MTQVRDDARELLRQILAETMRSAQTERVRQALQVHETEPDGRVTA